MEQSANISFPNFFQRSPHPIFALGSLGKSSLERVGAWATRIVGDIGTLLQPIQHRNARASPQIPKTQLYLCNLTTITVQRRKHNIALGLFFQTHPDLSSPLHIFLNLVSIGIMTSATEVSYGFIGLGQMGYGMAQNLRRKTHPASRFIICELDAHRRNQFMEETEGVVEVADTPAAVAEQSVRSLPYAIRSQRR